jgi:3-hydroxyisobutyrate dehydrogenase-like beta-hydroxyacid dehydrogenase
VTSIRKLNLGFVGLGVMGEPMCANLVRKSGVPVYVHDLHPERVIRAADAGAIAVDSVEAVGAEADVIFLSLPSIVQVESVCASLLAGSGRPSLVVDMSTSDVARTRLLAERLAAADIQFVDAPVARTKEAAVQGTLFISVGGSQELFETVQPFLAHMGSDVLHCGDVGCGQIVKVLNNMMALMTVNALSEILTIGRRAGMEGKQLFDALSRSSADSFILRNHGMKCLVPDSFPEKVFPVDYAIKDASTALQLAEQVDFHPRIARYTHDVLCKAQKAGFGLSYHPVVIRVVDGRVGSTFGEP